MSIRFHPELIPTHADRLAQPPRLLIVPGLHNSGPTHWRSWLQLLHPSAVRVEQRDWTQPQLDRWAGRITSTLERQVPRPVAGGGAQLWLPRAGAAPAAATRFAGGGHPAGARRPIRTSSVSAGLLPQGALTVPSTMVVSNTDPWMRAVAARGWAQRWGSHTVNLGDAGHINSAAGFGPLPLAQRWVLSMQQVLSRAERRDRTTVAAWSFAR